MYVFVPILTCKTMPNKEMLQQGPTGLSRERCHFCILKRWIKNVDISEKTDALTF